MADSPRRFPPEPLPTGQRIALRITYAGTLYCGWQAQSAAQAIPAVQTVLEKALASVAAEPVRVHCAGRTDTGVHATAQWIHFDAPSSRSIKSWIVGTNGQLPPSVRVADGCPVDDEFHARHSAESRRYDYLVANTATAPALLSDRALWVRDFLDAESMDGALYALRGERDFSAFRASSCQSRTPMRYLSRTAVHRQGDYLQITLEANAFLHHMVRNIVGSLIEVGSGRRSRDWLGQLLEGRDRSLAAATAPAHGLYLTDVRYPTRFALGAAPRPPFLPF